MLHTSRRTRLGPRWMSRGAVDVFDEKFRVLQKNKAMLASDSQFYEYLQEEVARRALDRINDVKREFEVLADLGAGTGVVAKELNKMTKKEPHSRIASIQRVIQVEDSLAMLKRDVHGEKVCSLQGRIDKGKVPLKEKSVDVVISTLSMNWLNDLPGFLESARKTLKPDGLFIGALYGEKTLQELTSAFALADQERCGGLSPHVSPFTTLKDMASLMQGAGFSLPTVDSEKILCPYPDMFTLMGHLQAMGETNSVKERRLHVPRDVFLAAASIFEELYKDEETQLMPVTFEVIYVIGWSPAVDQPKPLDRGTANTRMTDAFRIHKG